MAVASALIMMAVLGADLQVGAGQEYESISSAMAVAQAGGTSFCAG